MASDSPDPGKEAAKPRVDYEFHMNVTVLEPRGEGENRVARIRFATLEDAPEFARGVFVLELDASTGKPKALKEIEGNRGGSVCITKGGEEEVLLSDTPGFPTAWIINRSDLQRVPARTEDRSIVGRTGHSLNNFVQPS